MRAQEEGAQFDIHDYSDRFLSQVSNLVHHPLPKSKRDAGADPAIINFHAVAAGQSAPEVCRMFLACLQLANMGNVSVIPPNYGKEVSSVTPATVPSKARGKKTDVDAMATECSGCMWRQEAGFDLRLVSESRRLLDVENVF